jgi:hypothetical protein
MALGEFKVTVDFGIIRGRRHCKLKNENPKSIISVGGHEPREMVGRGNGA